MASKTQNDSNRLQHLQEQIELIAKHEQDFLERRTAAERIVDKAAGWIGSLWFIGFHAALIGLWIFLNTKGLSTARRFDPRPFPILNLLVACEAILLTSLVLMRQSRIGRRTDERNHLELQVTLLTEKEITAVLELSRAIAKRLGLGEIAQNPVIERLSQDTPIEEVVESIRENLPDP